MEYGGFDLVEGCISQPAPSLDVAAGADNGALDISWDATVLPGLIVEHRVGVFDSHPNFTVATLLGSTTTGVSETSSTVDGLPSGSDVYVWVETCFAGDINRRHPVHRTFRPIPIL